MSRRGSAPKPLPIHCWIEMVDDQMAALCASCISVKTNNAGHTWVWAASAFALVERRDLRRMYPEAIADWGAAAIAKACTPPRGEPPTRFHHLPLYARVRDDGTWELRA